MLQKHIIRYDVPSRLDHYPSTVFRIFWFQPRAVSRYESGPLEAAVYQLSEYCPTNGALQRSVRMFGPIALID